MRKSNLLRLKLALGAVLTLVWLMLITIGIYVYSVYHAPIPANVRGLISQLPVAVVLSLGRVTTAYLISLAIALPLAIYISQSSNMTDEAIALSLILVLVSLVVMVFRRDRSGAG